MSSQVLYFTSFFTHNIISNNFSQHWRAARNQSDRGLDSTAIEVPRNEEEHYRYFKKILTTTTTDTPMMNRKQRTPTPTRLETVNVVLRTRRSSFLIKRKRHYY